MTEIIDLVRMREHNAMTNFAKYLVETGWENDDFEPAHFCLLAVGCSACGGGFEYTSIGKRDRAALLSFIGMLEAAKHEALKKIDELDGEG